MRTILAGGTGFLGQALARALVTAGHDVVGLTRGAGRGPTSGGRTVSWTPDGHAGPWASEVHGATAVVRGIRNLTDFDYEAQMAAMNRKLNAMVETVFLLPQAELQCISSTLVREISQLGGDISHMVNGVVAEQLKPRPAQA